MSRDFINIIGWILFVISAVGFIIAGFGNFWSMFGSLFFLAGCLVFLIPYFNKKKIISKYPFVQFFFLNLSFH